MLKLNSILLPICLGLLFTTATYAQDTNAPKTRLEAFEARTGVVIARGSAEIGVIQAAAGSIIVRSKQSTDTSSGFNQSGISITITVPNQPADTTVVDFDELANFLSALDSLAKANWSSTALPGFDVFYTTRGGLQAAAYSSQKRPGTIGMSLKSSTVNRARISLGADEFALFSNLVQQAKTKLDSIQTAR